MSCLRDATWVYFSGRRLNAGEATVGVKSFWEFKAFWATLCGVVIIGSIFFFFLYTWIIKSLGRQRGTKGSFARGVLGKLRQLGFQDTEYIITLGAVNTGMKFCA